MMTLNSDSMNFHNQQQSVSPGRSTNQKQIKVDGDSIEAFCLQRIPIQQIKKSESNYQDMMEIMTFLPLLVQPPIICNEYMN